MGSTISPRLLKGGIVTMDADTSTIQSVIALQYNPDSLSRTLQIQALPGGQDGVKTLKRSIEAVAKVVLAGGAARK